jgi:hypothetical protein
MLSIRALFTGLVLCGAVPGLVADAHAQQIVSRQQCATNVNGSPVRGVVQIERWDYHDTHRFYGQFSDAYGTLIELEVFTNQPQGVGGMWYNHARHRETRIHVQQVQGGYVVTTEDGVVSRLACY